MQNNAIYESFAEKNQCKCVNKNKFVNILNSFRFSLDVLEITKFQLLINYLNKIKFEIQLFR